MHRTDNNVKQLPQAPLSLKEQAQIQITIKAAALQKAISDLDEARETLISLQMNGAEHSAYRGQSPHAAAAECNNYVHMQQTISELERTLFAAITELEEAKKNLEYEKSRPPPRPLPESPKIILS